MTSSFPSAEFYFDNDHSLRLSNDVVDFDKRSYQELAEASLRLAEQAILQHSGSTHVARFAIDQLRAAAAGTVLAHQVEFPTDPKAVAAMQKDLRKGLLWLGTLRGTKAGPFQHMKVDGAAGPILIVGQVGAGKTVFTRNACRVLAEANSVRATLIEMYGQIESDMVANDPDFALKVHPLGSDVRARANPRDAFPARTYTKMAAESLEALVSDLGDGRSTPQWVFDIDDKGRRNWRWYVIDGLDEILLRADAATAKRIVTALAHVFEHGPKNSVGIIATARSVDSLPAPLNFPTRILMGTRLTGVIGVAIEREMQAISQVSSTLDVLTVDEYADRRPLRAFCFAAPGNGYLCEFAPYAPAGARGFA